MLLKCLEVGEDPLCCVSDVVIDTSLVLGDEDVFLFHIPQNLGKNNEGSRTKHRLTAYATVRRDTGDQQPVVRKIVQSLLTSKEVQVFFQYEEAVARKTSDFF